MNLHDKTKAHGKAQQQACDQTPRRGAKRAKSSAKGDGKAGATALHHQKKQA